MILGLVIEFMLLREMYSPIFHLPYNLNEDQLIRAAAEAFALLMRIKVCPRSQQSKYTISTGQQRRRQHPPAGDVYQSLSKPVSIGWSNVICRTGINGTATTLF